MNNTVNSENWSFSQYKSSRIRAFISLGGEPGDENDFQELYLVTTTNEDYTKEFFQKPFYILENALQFLNSRYGHWEFLDLKITPNGTDTGGCGDCAAH